MKTTLLIVLAMVLNLAAADERPEAKTETGLKEATDKFLTRIAAGQTGGAFDDLLEKYWYDRAGLEKTKSTTRAQFEVELAKSQINLGKAMPNGIEFLGHKRLGKNVVRLVYLQRHENFVAPWSFTFYRAADEYKLTNVEFGDGVGDDLKSFTATEPAR